MQCTRREFIHLFTRAEAPQSTAFKPIQSEMGREGKNETTHYTADQRLSNENVCSANIVGLSYSQAHACLRQVETKEEIQRRDVSVMTWPSDEHDSGVEVTSCTMLSTGGQR